MKEEYVNFTNMKEKSLERINFIKNDLQTKLIRPLEEKSDVPIFVDMDTLTDEEMVEGDLYEE